MASHWQDGVKNISERVSIMWKKGLFTDHVIKVNGNDSSREFQINKTFLAIASPYFEGLFYGSITNANEKTEINDIDPKLFEIFLRYAYTDKLDLKKFADGKDMFVIADRFLMSTLQKQCLVIIKTGTNLSNILQAYEFYKFYNLKEEMKCCTEEIMANFSSIINSPEFLDIQKDTLIWILKQDYIVLQSEIELYNAAVRWIKAEKNLLKDEQNNKKLWTEIMCNIQFANMTPQEFSCGPVLDPYIPEEDKLAFLTKLSCDRAPIEFPKGYDAKSRKFLQTDEGDGEYSDSESRDLRLSKDWRRRLYNAVQCGDMSTIITLYRQGADLSAFYGKNRRSLLHVATLAGMLSPIKYMVAHNVNINATNSCNWTALHMACLNGHVEIVRWLMSNGADCDILTSANKVAYDLANYHIKDILVNEYFYDV